MQTFTKENEGITEVSYKMTKKTSMCLCVCELLYVFIFGLGQYCFNLILFLFLHCLFKIRVSQLTFS